MSHGASGSISLDNLQEVKGGFTIEGTSDLTKVSASNLESIKHDLSVKNNGKLSQLSMSNLEKVEGDMKIEGNGNLKQFQLNNLEEVKGGLVLKGDFDRFVIPPADDISTNGASISFSNLESVKGQATMRSSGDETCSDFDQMKSNGVFQGSYACSTGTSSSSDSSGLSAGGKAGVAIGVIVGVAVILGAIWFMVRRRKKAAAFASVPTAHPDDSEKGNVQGPNGGSLSPPSPPVAAVGDIPRKPVTPAPPDPEPEIPMLDSGHVHEAPTMQMGERRDPAQCFELDAGPIYSTHQQAINHD